MTVFLLQMAGAAVLGLLIAWWQGRRARRSRTDLASAGRTSLPARVGVGGGRPRAGRLVLTPTRAAWTPRRGSRRVDLGGAQLLSVAPATGWNARPDDVELRLSLPTGDHVTVLVDPDLADVLTDVLPGSAPADQDALSSSDVEPPTPARPGRSWWGWLVTALGALWIAAVACSYVTGYSTTATVTSGDVDLTDGFCPVVWEDPAQVRHTGEADCYDEPAGSTLHVRVTGWPDTGDPTMPGTYVGIALLFGLPPLAVGTWRLLYLRGRRHEWRAATAEPQLPPAASPATVLPELTAQDVVAGRGEQPRTVLDRLAPYAARQVPSGGWSHPDRPHGARTAVPATRFLARAWVPLVVGAAVLGLTWPQPLRWWVLHTHETVAVGGTSTGTAVVEGAGPFPGELTVQFTGPDGTPLRAAVTTSGEPPAGSPVEVVYAVDDPRQARLSGADDDLGRGALIGSGAAAGSLLLTGWRLAPLVRWRSRVSRIRKDDARPALGLLTADPGGRPLMLLTDPVVAPLRITALPLAEPLPSGTAAACPAGAQLMTRGRLAGGEAVVVELPGTGATLLPAGPAVDLDTEDLLFLLDAAHALAPDDAPDEEDAEEDAEATDPR